MDEELAESWEEAADSGEMEKRLEEKLRISQKEKDSLHNSSASPLKTAMVIQDDSLPAAPPPKIRILKRPASNGSLGSPLSQNRPTPQVKSLAQREAEYAEARKRILGSACPEETPQDKANSDRSARNNSSLPSEDARSNNHHVRQPDGSQGIRQHR
ncbi:SUZ RNA-binding domain-containing [Takifugu rubripes]|uniref:SUZ RNA-binding domain-containing n=1 Tax=Takifugu rubripes TaxID=31033 RepID=UPI0000362B43|nr:SUZ domain-containing protein 1-like [Takifugu rubripes]XP_056895927.1 SUZ domain-containing protein 1 [Takifugu flavidus]|eukprot:XP_003963011.1 PREDICTED: SUZ domain-containing protein 1-like [Takifugu rubripes]